MCVCIRLCVRVLQTYVSNCFYAYMLLQLDQSIITYKVRVTNTRILVGQRPEKYDMSTRLLSEDISL